MVVICSLRRPDVIYKTMRNEDLLDWRGEMCESHSRRKTPAGWCLEILCLLLYKNIEKSHCTDIFRIIVVFWSPRVLTRTLNITEGSDTVLIPVLSSTCTFSINTAEETQEGDTWCEARFGLQADAEQQAGGKKFWERRKEVKWDITL